MFRPLRKFDEVPMTVSRGSQEFSFPLRLAAYWQASLCFVLLALPCNANGLSGSVMHPVEAINMVSSMLLHALTLLP